MVVVSVLVALLALGAGVAAPAIALASSSDHGTARPYTEERARHRTEVVGSVLDEHGRPLAGVSVIATPVTTMRPVGPATITDAQGHFRIIGLPPGNYWFIGIDGDHPPGMTPALPVGERLEVSITLDLAVITA
jgi:hypothetical protein